MTALQSSTTNGYKDSFAWAVLCVCAFPATGKCSMVRCSTQHAYINPHKIPPDATTTLKDMHVTCTGLAPPTSNEPRTRPLLPQKAPKKTVAQLTLAQKPLYTQHIPSCSPEPTQTTPRSAPKFASSSTTPKVAEPSAIQEAGQNPSSSPIHKMMEPPSG
jgi:hypothetical protein